MDVRIRAFSLDAMCDLISVVNAYTSKWSYVRPIDTALVRYWLQRRSRFDPEHVLIAYTGAQPRAFLHGELAGDQYCIHLLAFVPGAMAEALALLKRAEELAISSGAGLLRGPHHRAGFFYGGYMLGLEPYHPHWAADGTEAYVRAGFKVTHDAVVMTADLTRRLEAEQAPAGCELVRFSPDPEYDANVLGFRMLADGQPVASATARHYPHLKSPGGGSVGQIGRVGTTEQHRNRGLARSLCRHCMLSLREMGAAEVLVATGQDNLPALRAYEHAGFSRRFGITEWSKPLAVPSDRGPGAVPPVALKSKFEPRPEAAVAEAS